MTPERQKRIKDLAARRFASLVVILEDISDPHNIGAILRSCDAVGVGEVQLVYPTKAPRMRELKTRSAASAAKWLNIKKSDSIKKCIALLHRRKFKVLVTALSDNGKAQWDWNLKGKVAILVGNEHSGASPDALRLADGIITIPMRGMVQSLNVSVATAVVLEEALRQRLAKKNTKGA